MLLCHERLADIIDHKPAPGKPDGDGKNCSVLRQANTLPCKETGTVLRMITFWFALITGTSIHPMIWAMHQMRGFLVNASRKFSVPSENSMVR